MPKTEGADSVGALRHRNTPAPVDTGSVEDSSRPPMSPNSFPSTPDKNKNMSGTTPHQDHLEGRTKTRESLKAQKKTYRSRKKEAAKELMSSITDPSVVLLGDWLKVRGTLKSWTKLWCVLKPGILILYKSDKHKGSQWVGTILLNTCQLLERPSKKDGFCFKLFHPLDQSIWATRGPKGETIGAFVQPLPYSYCIFRAPSESAGKCWMDALELALKCTNLLKRSMTRLDTSTTDAHSHDMSLDGAYGNGELHDGEGDSFSPQYQSMRAQESKMNESDLEQHFANQGDMDDDLQAKEDKVSPHTSRRSKGVLSSDMPHFSRNSYDNAAHASGYSSSDGNPAPFSSKALVRKKGDLESHSGYSGNVGSPAFHSPRTFVQKSGSRESEAGELYSLHGDSRAKSSMPSSSGGSCSVSQPHVAFQTADSHVALVYDADMSTKSASSMGDAGIRNSAVDVHAGTVKPGTSFFPPSLPPMSRGGTGTQRELLVDDDSLANDDLGPVVMSADGHLQDIFVDTPKPMLLSTSPTQGLPRTSYTHTENVTESVNEQTYYGYHRRDRHGTLWRAINEALYGADSSDTSSNSWRKPTVDELYYALLALKIKNVRTETTKFELEIEKLRRELGRPRYEQPEQE